MQATPPVPAVRRPRLAAAAGAASAPPSALRRRRRSRRAAAAPSAIAGAPARRPPRLPRRSSRRRRSRRAEPPPPPWCPRRRSHRRCRSCRRRPAPGAARARRAARARAAARATAPAVPPSPLAGLATPRQAAPRSETRKGSSVPLLSCPLLQTWPGFVVKRELVALALAVVAMSCTESRDLGSSVPHGRLPVDERNPILLLNDGPDDNWQGEYAVLLANSGGPALAGIVVNTSPGWQDLDANIAGWRGLVAAARASGLRDIPDPTASIGPALARPASGQIDDTAPNRSEGARLIVETSARLSLSYRPLVVVTGGRLTDVADAYLVDPTVTDRVVVVSSLGTTTASGGAMAAPERRDGSVGGRDRHRALSLRAGERLLRPAHGRSRTRACRSCPRTHSATGSPRSNRRSGTCRWPPIRSPSSRSVFQASPPRWSACPPRRSSAPARRRGPISWPIRTAPPGSSPRARAAKPPDVSGTRCSIRRLIGVDAGRGARPRARPRTDPSRPRRARALDSHHKIGVFATIKGADLWPIPAAVGHCSAPRLHAGGGTDDHTTAIEGHRIPRDTGYRLRGLQL